MISNETEKHIVGHVKWKHNLAVMWVAQCVSVMSFSVAFPFFPLFIQDIGISDPERAAFWAGISGSAMGVSMIVAGPMWGMMGDRFGRKKNVLRGLFCGGVVMALTGLSTNVYQLTGFRFLMGIASGTFAPAMALVAATSPRSRVAFSVGVLQSAMFVGTTLGPAIGGFLGSIIGFNNVFFVSGIGVASAGVLVLLFAREDFHRSADSVPVFNFDGIKEMLRLMVSNELSPILATIFIIHVAPALMFVVLPLIIIDIVPNAGVAASGLGFAILGITAALASYAAGWLSLHVSLTRIMVGASIFAAIFYLPLAFVGTVGLVYLCLLLGGMCQGLLVSASSGLIGRVIPREKYGAGFGSVQSVTAAGFSFGPLLGGTIAAVAGLRFVFIAQSVGLLLAGFLIVALLPRK